MNTNVARLELDEEVDQLVGEADQNTAFAVMETAWEIREREQRAMSLEEALAVVRRVAAQVEAMG